MEPAITIQFITQVVCRSFVFIAIYQVIAYQICSWKRRNIFSIPTLFKIEFLLHVMMKIWLLQFVSLSEYKNSDGGDQCGCRSDKES